MKTNNILILPLLCYVLISCTYTSKPNDVLFPIYVNGKYGYIDSTGKTIVEPKYLKAQDFSNGLGLVVTEYTIDNIKSTDKFLRITADLTKDSNILYIKKISYKYGYLNKTGEFQIKPDLTICLSCKWPSEKPSDSILVHFNELGFSDDLAVYQDTSGKFGYINTHGEVALTPLYDIANHFRGGLAPIAILDSTTSTPQRRWGYINTHGDIVIHPKYDQAESFYNGIATVAYQQIGDSQADGSRNIDVQYMGIDKQGNTQLGPYGFGDLGPFYEDFAIYNHWFLGCCYVDKSGKELTPNMPHNSLTSFNCGRGGVKLDNKWGFLSKQDLVIPPQYDSVMAFSEGLAAVMQDDHWGYIDTTGTLIIPYKYDFAGYFSNGLAQFELNQGSLKIEGYINRQGKIIWQHESLTKIQ